MENQKTKKYLSIKTKITLSIFIFIVVTLAIVLTASFLNTKRIIKQDLDLRLSDIVTIAVLNIDVDKHSTLKGPQDENTDNYRDVKNKLQAIRDNTNEDLTYVYTLREDDKGNILFIVDAEENEEDISHLGDIYEDPNQFLKDNFLTMNKVMVEKEFTSDKWGTWISAYAPFYDKDGKRDGILGVDIKASNVIAYERKVLITYLGIFILSGVLSLLLGLYISNRLTKSLNLITTFLKNNGKNTGIFPQSNDEVGDLSNILKTTLDEININQRNTEEKVSDKTKMLEKMNKLMIGRELEMIKLKKEIAELKNIKKTD